MRFQLSYLTVPSLAISLSAPAYAVQYLTIEEAQKVIFPEGKSFEPADFQLTEADLERITKSAGSKMRARYLRAWRVTTSAQDLGYLVVDDVVGKHEDITYAVGVSSAGKVVGVEILEYRETHGSDVKLPEWRAQFVNKSISDPIKVGVDIDNISGATLSCIHVTDGVKRILSLLEMRNATR